MSVDSTNTPSIDPAYLKAVRKQQEEKRKMQEREDKILNSRKEVEKVGETSIYKFPMENRSTA